MMQNYGWDNYSTQEYNQIMFLENRIKEQQQEVTTKLSTIVRLDKIDSFTQILAAAYDNECIEAINLADELDLDQSHFLALNDNYKAYETYFIENYSEDDDD
jgi:hypothetical protein